MDNKIKRIKIQQKITILSNFSLLRISGVSTSSGSIQRESPLHIYKLISTVIYKNVFTKEILRGDFVWNKARFWEFSISI